jgi:hypothetical protein
VIFESDRLAEEWASGKIHADLRRLAEWVDDCHWLMFRKPAFVTNVLYRPPGSSTTTHPEGRAIDLKTAGVGFFDPSTMAGRKIGDSYLKEVEALLLEDRINSAWDTGNILSDGSPMQCAVVHNIGLGPHLHLQVARGRFLKPKPSPTV